MLQDSRAILNTRCNQSHSRFTPPSALAVAVVKNGSKIKTVRHLGLVATQSKWSNKFLATLVKFYKGMSSIVIIEYAISLEF